MRNALSAEGRNNSVPFLHWWCFDKAVKQLEVSAGFRRWWIDLATPLSSDVIFANLKWKKFRLFHEGRVCSTHFSTSAFWNMKMRRYVFGCCLFGLVAIVSVLAGKYLI